MGYPPISFPVPFILYPNLEKISRLFIHAHFSRASYIPGSLKFFLFILSIILVVFFCVFFFWKSNTTKGLRILFDSLLPNIFLNPLIQSQTPHFCNLLYLT